MNNIKTRTVTTLNTSLGSTVKFTSVMERKCEFGKKKVGEISSVAHERKEIVKK